MATKSKEWTEAQRRALVEVLGPQVEDLAHEVSLVAGALKGPDPEYALDLLGDVLRDAGQAFRKVVAEVRP